MISNHGNSHLNQLVFRFSLNNVPAHSNSVQQLSNLRPQQLPCLRIQKSQPFHHRFLHPLPTAASVANLVFNCHAMLEKKSLHHFNLLPPIKPWRVVFVRLEVKYLVAVVHRKKVDGQLQACDDLGGNLNAAVQELVPVDSPEPRVLPDGERSPAVAPQSQARINHEQLFEQKSPNIVVISLKYMA